MRYRSRALFPLIAALVAGSALASPAEDLGVTVTNLRSSKGKVLACLTARADTFPHCEKDPQARKLIVPAAPEVHLDFGIVPDGRYAVSVIHDENGNGKLDTTLIIPREGFGFSRDAPVRMGPPRFEKAAFDVNGHGGRLALKMRYLL